MQYKTRVVPAVLSSDVISANYPKGDFHTFYLGEISGVLGDEDVEDKLT